MIELNQAFTNITTAGFGIIHPIIKIKNFYIFFVLF